MENETKSVWQKKQDELTMADQMKIAAVVTAVVTVISVAPFVAIGAWAYVAEKRQMRKEENAKKAKLEVVE